MDAGIDYTMEEPIWAPDRCVGTNPGMPVFAPPVLKKGDFYLSQTSAIMNYLGEAHGYSPVGAEDKASCLQLVMDAGDIMAELFQIAKEADKKAAFVDKRLLSWLLHFEKVFMKSGEEASFLMGDKVTQADFALLAAIESLDFSVGIDKVKEILPKCLASWRATMEARPFFAGYLSQTKPSLFESMKA